MFAALLTIKSKASAEVLVVSGISVGAGFPEPLSYQGVVK